MNQPLDSLANLRRAADYSSFMLWLYDLPVGMFASLTIILFVGVALGGLALFHRRIHASELADLLDNGTVGWFFSGTNVLYGLLLGLLTIATWGSYTAASSLASQEAAALSVLYNDLSGYPQPQRNQLEAQLRQYTRFIIQRSWPAQRRGYINDGETSEMRRFRNQFMSVEPRTEGDKLLHGEAIRAFNTVIELRRLRAESISGSVPPIIWYVVMGGAILTLLFSYFFSIKAFGLHAILTGMLAAMIGLLIFLIAALDHPYRGEVSVTPEAYQLVLDKVMKPLPALTRMVR